MAVDVDRVESAVADRVERTGAILALGRTQSTSESGVAPATPFVWALILVAVALFNELAFEQLHAGQAQIYGRENGPLEQVQMLVLVPALILFAVAWWKGVGAVRVAGALLALLAATALIREIDLKTLSGSISAIDWLAAAGLQDGLFTLFGIVAVLYMFRQRRYVWELVRLGARWQAWPCCLSLLLLAIAEFYLDGFEGPAGHFWEELVEANAYFLFAVAAWRHLALIGDRQLDRPL